ncbi:MAG: hypothetical protein ACXW2E_12855 [Nitrososphaeraceae archaeon]
MTSEFIFDIFVKYKHTKEKQEEIRAKEKENENVGYRNEKYFPHEHSYLLTQVKITTNYDIAAAMLSAYKITDVINANLDKYVVNQFKKEFDYWVVPILGKFSNERNDLRY